jgi:hypothetical protein
MESAAEEALDKALDDLDAWVETKRKIWGDEWARKWKEASLQRRREGRQQIAANARQIADYQRAVERQAAAAGYKVTWQ